MNPWLFLMDLKSNTGKILILGAQGQVGRALVAVFGADKVTATARQAADLSNPKSCVELLETLKPSAVFNAAAYTQVDLAEKEPDLARKVNADSPGEMARWCALNKAPFIHFSTDYVFPGGGTTPWKETDQIAPLNTYGRTKAEGEHKIAASEGQYLIFRTSWVYDSQGKNFLNTMLKFGKEREALKIVSDQHGAPTYAPDLARAAANALQIALEKPIFPSGIYHACNQGETTWYDFAQAIFELARNRGISLKVKNLERILSSEFPTPAERPKNSRLCTAKMRDVLGIQLPEWQESLKLCMQEVHP